MSLYNLEFMSENATQKTPTVHAAGTLQWAPTDTMKDFRWHYNNVLHKIYIQFYVQFTHFVMMMFLSVWDIY